MKVFVFILILFAASYAVIVPAHICPGTRDSLLPCFNNLIDLDNDGKITTAELDTMYVSNAAMLSKYQGRYSSSEIMRRCDTDSNGWLDIVDWNSNKSCLLSENDKERDFVCRLCYMCQH